VAAAAAVAFLTSCHCPVELLELQSMMFPIECPQGCDKVSGTNSQ
jgi:hypothetical protein